MRSISSLVFMKSCYFYSHIPNFLLHFFLLTAPHAIVVFIFTFKKKDREIQNIKLAM